MDGISTHTPLAGRDLFMLFIVSFFAISTHTPLAGRDGIVIPQEFVFMISTHTPLAGRDLFLKNKIDKISKFLLTRPSRGATL